MAAFVLALLLIGYRVFAPRPEEGARRPGIAFAADTATADMLVSPFKAVYEQVSPSIVGIQVTARASAFGGRILALTDHAGSGVMISDDGYVVTNYHVVDGAESVHVVQGDAVYRAEFVAGDAGADIAVLRIPGREIPAAKAGDSDALTVGDWALVIGNPLGEQFANTLTVGVISGLGRDLSDRGTRAGQASLIQTNAAINAGNSGGGLFNISGELVGITSMKLSNNGYYGYASIEGIGFALPMNNVKKIVGDLIAYGRVLYPRIGVTMRDISSPSMEPTPEMLPKSVWVTAVEPGLPADRAGIRADDLVLSVDGVRVTTAVEIQNAIRARQEGEKIRMMLYRIPGLTGIGVDEPIPAGEFVEVLVEIVLMEG